MVQCTGWNKTDSKQGKIRGKPKSYLYSAAVELVVLLLSEQSRSPLLVGSGGVTLKRCIERRWTVSEPMDSE